MNLFRYSFCDDWLLLFNKNDTIDRLIFLKNENLYNLDFDNKNQNIIIASKNEKKNLLIIKYKTTYIKYNKYNKLTLKFENYEEMKKLLSK